MKIKNHLGIAALAAVALAACQPKQEAKPDFLTEEINNIVAQHTIQTDIIEKKREVPESPYARHARKHRLCPHRRLDKRILPRKHVAGL